MTYEIIHGDCLDVLRGMDAASVDAIVTDPPYCRTGDAASVVTRGGSIAIETQFYDAWLREHVREWARLLKPSGSVWMTVDWRGALSFDSAAVRSGLSSAKIGVWDRGGLGMGHAMRNTYECFAFAYMPKWAKTHTDMPDVWRYKWTPGNREHGHSAEKPTDLLKQAIQLCIGRGKTGTVLDPFVGSGSTGCAAASLGLDFIGIEREADYCEIARKRIAAAAAQGNLFHEVQR